MTCHLYKKSTILQLNSKQTKHSQMDVCWCEHPCSSVSEHVAKFKIGDYTPLKCEGNLQCCEIPVVQYLDVKHHNIINESTS